MKTCSKCREELPLDSFGWKSRGKDSRQPYCRECNNERNRAYYEQNKQAQKSRVLARNTLYKKEIRSWLTELKESSACADCKKFYPHYVMDFDHIRGVKSFNISHAVARGYSKAKILGEINKCEIVCSNCHRVRTFGV